MAITALYSPYEYYLDVLGTWPGSIPPYFSWFILFDFSSVAPLRSNISNVLNTLEPNNKGWRISKVTTDALLNKNYQEGIDGLVGCVFARDVRLPGELIEFDRNSGLNYAGLQTPATINNRKSYEDLEIQFTETTASFTDFVLRPWLIATSFYGLIARRPGSPRYIKSNFIDVVQLAKTGTNNKMQPRKITRFVNCAPTGINDTQLTYESSSIQGVGTRFIYDSYSVLEGNTGALIQSGRF